MGGKLSLKAFPFKLHPKPRTGGGFSMSRVSKPEALRPGQPLPHQQMKAGFFFFHLDAKVVQVSKPVRNSRH